MRKLKTMSLLVAVVFASTTVVACDRMTERWATTENTNVKIDFDKVNEAYRAAEGPEDFERRVNEIYEGDEVISVAVQDRDARTQVVTGFFDHDGNGQVADGEKIFTIQRDVTGEGSGQYQTVGYGSYGYYHSPIMSIASGMLLGSMLSSAFRPGYAPVYVTPYATSSMRAGQLRSVRTQYRAANPSRFSPSKASGSGRRYNSAPSGSRGFGRSSGGTRFGARRRPGKRTRLDA